MDHDGLLMEKATHDDTKAAKKAKDKAAAVSNSGVGLLQSFFFNKKQSPPAPAPAATPRSPPVLRGTTANGGDGDPNRLSTGRISPTGPARTSRANGSGGVSNGDGASNGDTLQRQVEEAVPEEFAGWSWEGYLHHADFIVALMHVGTSLMPKNLIKVSVFAGACWSSVAMGQEE